MADDERIARLTELARRAYNDDPSITVWLGHNEARVEQQHREEDGPLMCVIHERSADALKAALLVLAGEPIDRVHMPCNARICILEAKLARLEGGSE